MTPLTAIGLMLSADAADVGAMRTNRQHEFKREPRFRSSGVLLPILLDLGRRPRVPSLALVYFLNVDRRIARGEFLADSSFEQRAEILHQIVGCAGRRSPLVAAALDVLFAKERIRQLAGGLAKAIEDAALVSLRQWIELGELAGAEY